MSKGEIPCSLCLGAGVDEEEAAAHVHVSGDPKYDVNARPTGICMRVSKHPHGGPAQIFLDTGELARAVKPSPLEQLYTEAPDPPSVWGLARTTLKRFGVRGFSLVLADEFRERESTLGKKLPSRKLIADSEANSDPIDIYPLYDETHIVGIEIRLERPKTGGRPGDSGSFCKGKEVRILGESGLFISDPFPKRTPEMVVAFEGAKDACIAAADAKDGDMQGVVFCGCSANFNKEMVGRTIRLRFPGATLIAIGDRDKAGTNFNKKMLKIGAILQALPGCSGKDLGDEQDQYLRIEAVKQAVAAGVAEWRRQQEQRPSDLSVMAQLQKEGLAKVDDNGILRASSRPHALARILELDPTYGVYLRRNLMGMRDYHNDTEITDEHVVQIQNDLDHRYGATWGIEQLERQIALRCSQNGFHPVRDYFDGLPAWDGKDRYSWIITQILGGADTALNRAQLACFFRGAVARIRVPGCKHDVVLILKSAKQGVRKTSFFHCCCANIPGAFVEGHEDVVSKDGLLIMHRGFIIELGEIDRITSKKDAEILKNFLSRRADIVRPPYGRRAIEMLRAFAVVGTTNQGSFLMDTTGHRRFLVIETGDKPFNLELLLAELDQIWAQAVSEYETGLPWWLDTALEEDHQQEMEAFQAEEPWTVLIDKALLRIKKDRNKAKEVELLCEGVTVAEILEKMDIRAEAQNRGQANRVAEILRNMSWWRMENQVRRGEKRLRLWFPPYQDMLDEIAETKDISIKASEVKATYMMSQPSH